MKKVDYSDSILSVGALSVIGDIDSLAMQKTVTESHTALQEAAKRNVEVQNLIQNTPSFFYDETVPPGPYKAGDFWVHDNAIFISQAARSEGEGVETDWVWYIRPNIVTSIESSNGNIFKPGQTLVTTLFPRAFKNGLEITGSLPDSAFKWTRKSFYEPNNDTTWNANHAAGYRSIEVTADSIYARATYMVEISE